MTFLASGPTGAASFKLSSGRPAGFTVDGPRGPAGVAQPGAVWLAKATGNPVLPFHLEADRHWSLRSWDRTQIPKPFATVALAVGEPFDIPQDANEETVERGRQELEKRLRGLEARASELLGSDTTVNSQVSTLNSQSKI